jgi:DNA-directed RNA polymerase subunit RPC12/RpoP
MTAGRIISYVAAAIFLIFGFLFVLAAFGEQFNSGWLIIGFVLVAIGFGLIYLGGRLGKAAQAEQNVTVNIDLPANVDLDKFKCENCGGELSTDNVEMVAGAPVLNCPYCGTTYQLKEEPKW